MLRNIGFCIRIYIWLNSELHLQNITFLIFRICFYMFYVFDKYYYHYMTASSTGLIWVFFLEKTTTYMFCKGDKYSNMNLNYQTYLRIWKQAIHLLYY